MSITLRRLIAGLFILIFLLTAPLLILYTAGWRYNFKKSEPEKAGALIIETKPSGAEVTLNGELQDDKTPSRFNNLLPQDYNIAVTKDGYYSWSKKLSVQSQNTTFAENIFLFAKSEPQIVATEPISWLSFSPDGRLAALADTNNKINFINLNSGKTFEAGAIRPAVNPTIFWANHEGRLLFQTTDETLIINTAPPQFVLDLSAAIKKNALTNCRWHEDDPNLLFCQSGQKIFQYNILTQEFSVYFELKKTETLLDYLTVGDKIYLIEKFGDRSILAYYSPNGQRELAQTLELPSADFRFDKIYGDKIGLRRGADAIYFIDGGLSQIAFQRQAVKYLSLSDNEDNLLITADNEVSGLDLSAAGLTEKNFGRWSGGATKALWHKTDNYIFVLQNRTLRAIELDDRGGRFTLDLPAGEVTDFAVNSKGDALYYLSTGKLYSLDLEN